MFNGRFCFFIAPVIFVTGRNPTNITKKEKPRDAKAYRRNGATRTD